MLMWNSPNTSKYKKYLSLNLKNLSKQEIFIHKIKKCIKSTYTIVALHYRSKFLRSLFYNYECWTEKHQGTKYGKRIIKYNNFTNLKKIYEVLQLT